MRLLFWTSTLLLAYAQAGYGVALGMLWRLRRGALPGRAAVLPHEPAERPPRVALIVAAHREADVIAGKVRDALALDWPRDRLEVIVAVDGADELTAQRARQAGADAVLELPRAGKVRAQDAAVRSTTAELLAFSDANATWEPTALSELAGAFADEAVGYACGEVRFVNEAGDNQEGLYWRYELWLRERESDLASVTAGNGAIYAVRREAYFEGDPRVSHDLAFPYALVKRGWRCVYVPAARATERMVPSIEGEWRRKRRMMAHAWPAVATGGLADPRGYPPLYAWMIASHRLLRYATPFLHLTALVSARRGALVLQAGVLAAAAAGTRVPARPLLLARYYVLTTTAIALGLHDWLRHGTPAGWDRPEGTR